MTDTANDRVERFTKRLDDHLASLPDDTARKDFCEQQLERWEELYNNFQINPPDKPNSPSAFDYLLTITHISARRLRYV